MTLIFFLKNLPTGNARKKKVEKKSQWKYNQKYGWETYKKLTEEASNNILVTPESDVIDLAIRFEKH